ncbi:MAG: HU family DNA-binding protein [Treponema sp.]|nr:HU family DNA-binding protein [Treponema sp.]
MTRQELVKDISVATGLNKKDCGAVLTAMLEELYKALENNEKYTHTGFGTFETKLSAERIGTNPFTKQRVRYPKKQKLSFKAAKLLKDTLNEE